MTENYRNWMAEHGIIWLERPMGSDAQGFLIAEHFDGRIFELSIYEHGPGDSCGRSDEEHRAHWGWSPLDGAFQIIEMSIALRAPAAGERRGA